jgi:hypothetical protein
MPTDRPAAAQRPPSARSAVSNASTMLPGVDGRSALARRFRDLAENLAADIGGELTEAERLTVRSAAALAVHAEELQARIIRGESVNPDDVIRSANASARLLSVLKRGRQRKPTAGPSPLAAYLAEKAREEAAA